MTGILKKLLIIASICFVSICISVYLFCEYGGYVLLDKEHCAESVSLIKRSPTLPPRFYTLYNKVYPNTLNKNLWRFYAKAFLLARVYRDNNNIYREVSYTLGYYRIKDFIPATFYLKDQVSPEQCLNCMMQRYDFLNNARGIRNASRFYYDKELEHLNDKEMIGLIVMIKNPSYFNKLRFPERHERKVKEILKMIEVDNNP